MSVLKVKNGDQWDIVPAIKGDTGDPAANESITDDMLVPDGIKTEIDWLWGNQLMDIREGELLHAEDAYAAPAVDISVDGKSTQVTTTGKNLLSDATDTWANYTIVQGIYKYVEIDVPPTTQLTVSPTSTVAISGISGFNGYVVFWFDTTMFLNANIIYPINAGTPRVMTFTSGANGKLRVGLVNTMTQEALDVLWAKVKLQLEAGSSATAYEPYTGGKASPNPDYPQEIVNIDNPALKSCGKNFLPPNFATQTVNGVTFTGNSDGTIVINGTATALAIPSFVFYLPAGTYTLSGCPTGGNWDTYYAYVQLGSNPIARDFGKGASFTLDDKATLRYAIRIAANMTLSNKIFHPQVELGSIATDHEQYVGNSVVIPVTLRSLPDGTKDELHLSYLRPSTREGWAWYSRELVKRVGEVDLGTLSWGEYSQDNTFFTNISGIYRRYLGTLCTAYKQAQGGVDTLTNGTFTTSSGGNTSVWFRNDSYTIKEDFKAAVSGVMFNYILATPITTQLDPIELPIIPSQTVNVWSDPATNLKMTYIQDSNLIIENLEATIDDIAIS